jgi:hypothetical protein
MPSEETLRRALEAAAVEAYGQQRAAELSRRLTDVARWLTLVQSQPLDLLDEEPDGHGG